MTHDDEPHPLPRPRTHRDDPAHPGPDPVADLPLADAVAELVRFDDDALGSGRTIEHPDHALELLLAVVGPERSGPPALWFVVLDPHDRALPVVLPVPEVPTIADPQVARNLVHALAAVIEREAPGGAVVIGYVRRGGGDRGAFESGWSTVLREEADRTGVRIRVECALGRDRARVLDPRW
jgi:hypothetical protein